MKTKLLALCVLMMSFNQANAEKISDLEGFWSNDCEYNGAAIKHNKSDDFVIELSSNQIYILAHAIENREKSYYEVYFVDPINLGRGGLQIQWQNISKDIPLGKVSDIKSTSYEFEFYGIEYKDKDKDKDKDISQYMYHEFTGKKELILYCDQI
ncbi:hypothetical protein ACU6U9_20270 [Pseudomonas sp. HK3]